jgi:hypothetical protein
MTGPAWEMKKLPSIQGLVGEARKDEGKRTDP